MLTAGQRHDSTQTQALFAGLTVEEVMADRGAAGASRIACLRARGYESLIPPHQCAKVKRAYAIWLYREHQLADKLDRSFLGFAQFVCALVWLR